MSDSTIPARVGGDKLLCFQFLPKATVITRVSGPLEINLLAICKCSAQAGFYLFGCNNGWQTYTDTWHEDIEDAKEQATFKFNANSKAWIGLD